MLNFSSLIASKVNLYKINFGAISEKVELNRVGKSETLCVYTRVPIGTIIM